MRALELPLSQEEGGRPEKLLPSLSEAPCAGLVMLTCGWPGTGSWVPAGMRGIRNRTLLLGQAALTEPEFLFHIRPMR